MNLRAKNQDFKKETKPQKVSCPLGGGEGLVFNTPDFKSSEMIFTSTSFRLTPCTA